MIEFIKRGISWILIDKMVKSVVKSIDENRLSVANISKNTGEKGIRGLIVKYLGKSARKILDSNYAGAIMMRNFLVSKPGMKMLRKALTETSPSCRRKAIHNIVINAFLLGGLKRDKLVKKGFAVPLVMVISPTMRCNLNCIGCYAGYYSKEEDMDFRLIDRIIKEAKKMGIYFITLSGGEAFYRKDLFDIFKKHNDVIFQVYTNGTLIDKDMAKNIAEIGNILPAISVEGFEKETDKRRGKGTFKKVMEAMDNLKNEGVIFGFSATPTKLNHKKFYTGKFIDFYIKKGCLFGWFFQYMPIGKKPDVNLMIPPKQRNIIREKVHEIRRTKPIFVADFWNDGIYSEGCIAAGKNYIHINNRGDVEPCVFAHFAVDNIKNKSLKDALNSQFFKDIRKAQPFGKNLLAPCMIIDHPQVLRNVCMKNKAYPTHLGADSIIKDKKIVRFLDKYSKEIQKVTAKQWKERYSHFVERRKLI